MATDQCMHIGNLNKSLSSFHVAVNKTLLAFAADCRADVNMDRKAAAPAADVPCSKWDRHKDTVPNTDPGACYM